MANVRFDSVKITLAGAMEVTNPNTTSRPALIFMLALALAASFVGCEQRYVGGPVAIVRGTPPKHGLIGVTFGVPPNTLMLTDVVTDGPAFQAGIQNGDEILAVNQIEVETSDEVLSILRSTQPGDQIVVRIRRSRDENDFLVKLGRAKGDILLYERFLLL